MKQRETKREVDEKHIKNVTKNETEESMNCAESQELKYYFRD